MSSNIDLIVKRLLDPQFGSDTTERLLMGSAADAIRYLQGELAEALAKTTHLAKQEVDIRTAYGTVRADSMQLVRESKRLEREWAASEARVRELTLLLDKQMGTPCEQIRHQQELEAALAAEREDAITAYAGHIDVALRDYDDNLRYGDDALGPEFFIERGMERAAEAIRAQIAAPGAAMEAQDVR